MEQGSGDAHSLLHASREGSNGIVSSALQIYTVQDAEKSIFIRSHAIETAKELQILQCREISIDKRVVRKKSDSSSRLLSLSVDVEALNKKAAVGRSHQCRCDFEERCLSGAIAAEHNDKFSTSELQGYISDGKGISELLLDST
jgi:hypothetical protein